MEKGEAGVRRIESMIMVDIYVPAVDKEYDFSLDSNVEIRMIIEEISEMIAHKEQSEIVGNMDELFLCDRSTKRILPEHETLNQCGIQTGNKLILI